MVDQMEKRRGKKRREEVRVAFSRWVFCRREGEGNGDGWCAKRRKNKGKAPGFGVNGVRPRCGGSGLRIWFAVMEPPEAGERVLVRLSFGRRRRREGERSAIGARNYGERRRAAGVVGLGSEKRNEGERGRWKSRR
ncbi:hypothetical protein HAX54_027083 [Datura stramonium]|uniref:Uncharacterized protein n=1 Tax=Datura stramonium TaxID=4076 RepID=A0ABS8V4R4_DATST|nr:hypothetical protein [Datura stramonium]